MKITQDVKRGKLHSAYAVGAFDEAKGALENAGYRIISLEEQAGLRIQEGADSSVSQRGNWTREGVIYVPKKGIFLTKDSPALANATEATICHRNGNDFYLTEEQVEKALADSVKIEAGDVPVTRLADDERTAFAFGKNARAYGEFLKENRVARIPIYLANSQDKSFARQMWLQGMFGVCESYLDGDGDLGYGNGEVRGVRASADSKGATVARKSGKPRVEVYTAWDVQRALKSLKLSGLESQILETLKSAKQ